MRHIWSNEELEIIKRELDAGKMNKEIHELLPHIRFWELIEKSKDLRAIKIFKKKWKDEEIKRLTRYYLDGMPKMEIIEKFPNKTSVAVRAKLREVRLNHEFNWTKDNIETMKEMLSRGMGYKKISRVLGCGELAVSSKCFELGFTSVKAYIAKMQHELRAEGKKKCLVCNTIKPIEEFGYRCAACEQCTPKYLLTRRNAASLITRIRIKLGTAKTNARNNKREFAINENDILELWKKQDGKCFYSGIPLSYKHNDKNCFSIDRIDSSKGYIKNNICLVLAQINYSKLDFSVDEFVSMCRRIVEHTKNWDIKEPENYKVSELSLRLSEIV